MSKTEKEVISLEQWELDRAQHELEFKGEHTHGDKRYDQENFYNSQTIVDGIEELYCKKHNFSRKVRVK